MIVRSIWGGGDQYQLIYGSVVGHDVRCLIVSSPEDIDRGDMCFESFKQ